MSKVKIVSTGSAHGTTVMVNGKELDNVTKAEILPIVPGCLVTEKLTLIDVELDIEAEANDPSSYESLHDEPEVFDAELRRFSKVKPDDFEGKSDRLHDAAWGENVITMESTDDHTSTVWFCDGGASRRVKFTSHPPVEVWLKQQVAQSKAMLAAKDKELFGNLSSELYEFNLKYQSPIWQDDGVAVIDSGMFSAERFRKACDAWAKVARGEGW